MVYGAWRMTPGEPLVPGQSERGQSGGGGAEAERRIALVEGRGKSMPEQDALTIEMEPVRGGQEFGPAQPEPQQVNGVTDEQMQHAAQFEQRYGATAKSQQSRC